MICLKKDLNDKNNKTPATKFCRYNGVTKETQPELITLLSDAVTHHVSVE